MIETKLAQEFEKSVEEQRGVIGGLLERIDALEKDKNDLKLATDGLKFSHRLEVEVLLAKIRELEQKAFGDSEKRF